MRKRILTIDDLVKFCANTGFSLFSAQDSGYQLSVQMPEAIFEINNDDDNDDDSLWYGTIKAFHIGPNRNKSSVTLDAAKRAMPKMKYKPVLAEIAEISDTGEKDFTTHAMEITEDGVNYIEKQVGCFTADDPWIKSENDKEYICARVAISKIYTDTVDILERKGGTKVSVELGINQMSWDAKENILLLEDVDVQGITLLGHLENGTEVQEGMEGAFLDIQDFSTENNSISKNSDTNLNMIETLANANFNINSLGKEESSVNLEENTEMFEEDIEKEVTVEESVEVIETEAADTPNPVKTEKCGGGKDDDEDDDDKDDEEEDYAVEVEAKDDKDKPCKTKCERVYELSHDDVRYALYNLLAPFEEVGGSYYYIIDVYDSHFVFADCDGSVYGCKYSKIDDIVSLDGDIYSLYPEFLTETEKATIDTMRGNYDAVCDKLAKYEAEPTKMEVLSQECYSSIADSAEFKELLNFDTHFDMSVEEVSAKADAILLDYAKNNQLNFSDTEINKAVECKQLPVTKTKKSRYGNLFR